MRTVSFWGHKLPWASVELCSIPLRFILRVILMLFMALHSTLLKCSAVFHSISLHNAIFLFHCIIFVLFSIVPLFHPARIHFVFHFTSFHYVAFHSFRFILCILLFLQHSTACNIAMLVFHSTAFCSISIAFRFILSYIILMLFCPAVLYTYTFSAPLHFVSFHSHSFLSIPFRSALFSN